METKESNDETTKGSLLDKIVFSMSGANKQAFLRENKNVLTTQDWEELFRDRAMISSFESIFFTGPKKPAKWAKPVNVDEEAKNNFLNRVLAPLEAPKSGKGTDFVSFEEVTSGDDLTTAVRLILAHESLEELQKRAPAPAVDTKKIPEPELSIFETKTNNERPASAVDRYEKNVYSEKLTDQIILLRGFVERNWEQFLNTDEQLKAWWTFLSHKVNPGWGLPIYIPSAQRIKQGVIYSFTADGAQYGSTVENGPNPARDAATTISQQQFWQYLAKFILSQLPINDLKLWSALYDKKADIARKILLSKRTTFKEKQLLLRHANVKDLTSTEVEAMFYIEKKREMRADGVPHLVEDRPAIQAGRLSWYELRNEILADTTNSMDWENGSPLSTKGIWAKRSKFRRMLDIWLRHVKWVTIRTYLEELNANRVRNKLTLPDYLQPELDDQMLTLSGPNIPKVEAKYDTKPTGDETDQKKDTLLTQIVDDMSMSEAQTLVRDNVDKLGMMDWVELHGDDTGWHGDLLKETLARQVAADNKEPRDADMVRQAARLILAHESVDELRKRVPVTTGDDSKLPSLTTMKAYFLTYIGDNEDVQAFRDIVSDASATDDEIREMYQTHVQGYAPEEKEEEEEQRPRRRSPRFADTGPNTNGTKGHIATVKNVVDSMSDAELKTYVMNASLEKVPVLSPQYEKIVRFKASNLPIVDPTSRDAYRRNAGRILVHFTDDELRQKFGTIPTAVNAWKRQTNRTATSASDVDKMSDAEVEHYAMFADINHLMSDPGKSMPVMNFRANRVLDSANLVNPKPGKDQYRHIAEMIATGRDMTTSRTGPSAKGVDVKSLDEDQLKQYVMFADINHLMSDPAKSTEVMNFRARRVLDSANLVDPTGEKGNYRHIAELIATGADMTPTSIWNDDYEFDEYTTRMAVEHASLYALRREGFKHLQTLKRIRQFLLYNLPPRVLNSNDDDESDPQLEMLQQVFLGNQPAGDEKSRPKRVMILMFDIAAKLQAGEGGASALVDQIVSAPYTLIKLGVGLPMVAGSRSNFIYTKSDDDKEARHHVGEERSAEKLIEDLPPISTAMAVYEACPPLARYAQVFPEEFGKQAPQIDEGLQWLIKTLADNHYIVEDLGLRHVVVCAATKDQGQLKLINAIPKEEKDEAKLKEWSESTWDKLQQQMDQLLQFIKPEGEAEVQERKVDSTKGMITFFVLPAPVRKTKGRWSDDLFRVSRWSAPPRAPTQLTVPKEVLTQTSLAPLERIRLLLLLAPTTVGIDRLLRVVLCASRLTLELRDRVLTQCFGELIITPDVCARLAAAVEQAEPASSTRERKRLLGTVVIHDKLLTKNVRMLVEDMKLLDNQVVPTVFGLLGHRWHEQLRAEEYGHEDLLVALRAAALQPARLHQTACWIVRALSCLP